MSFSGTVGGALQGKWVTHQAPVYPENLWRKTWWVTKQPVGHREPSQLQVGIRVLLLPTLRTPLWYDLTQPRLTELRG